jgi:DNA segregation ATPase FtsK/SpoIIIE, S-DNA-T family
VGERLELRVTLTGLGDEADVTIRASPSDRVGDLARAAAESIGEPPIATALWCERRDEELGADVQLGSAGIRWGDRLRWGSTPSEPTHVGGAARVTLVVSGGPCAGESFELGDGTYRLGRDPEADIYIPDPSLSRHHLDVQVDRSGVRVADAGSSNGTALDGVGLSPGEFLRLATGNELELGRTLLRAQAVGSTPEHGIAQRDGRLDFNRPPRVNRQHAPFKRELRAPPSRRRKGRLPLAASLVPLAAGLVLFLLLKSPVMLAVAGLSPMMAISTYVSDRRGGRKSFARESAEYESQLQRELEAFDAAIAQETIARRIAFPDAATLIQQLNDLAPTLWERRPSDRDFLRLRVGVADQPPDSALELQEGGEPEIREVTVERLAERGSIPSVPLSLDVRAAGLVGMAGPHSRVVGLARWLVLQAAILHSPGELVVVAALSPASVEEWSWLKWLPHLRPDRVGLQTPAIAVGGQETGSLLAEVRELVRQRRSQARSQAPGGASPPQLVVIVDERTDVDRSLLSAALTDAAEQAIAVIWLGRETRDLPGQTGAIIELDPGRATLTLTEVASGTVTDDASVDSISADLAERAARALAPIRDVSELARGGDIPKRVGLLELIGLLPPTAEALEDRWRGWKGDLRATVGVSADGVLELDLRSEGPHALIAGTTGSGKSELLRTLVAAAAATIPPDRLAFLLVDYKGGAAFAPCAALPHVVDIISDLDEHLAERALVSLNAELKRRERILAEHGAKDLLELTRRDAAIAPPLLVIAVDEFAKLREEVPQFVDGVVDIAQRGRSLGVHMVLAAQTLRNAFTPAIRANTNLRLALRVSEESESEDMIASPVAARIPSGESSRGRAFARTGHGELREFQAAYISGLSDAGERRELQVSPFDLYVPGSIDTAAAATADSDAESDLVALGDAARRAQVRMALEVASAPWLPMLPSVLDLASLEHGGAVFDGTVAVGLVDLPQLQRQDPLLLDLRSAGHIAVFGAGNSGKTTALTSTALALARSSTPDELTIYCLDAAGGGLAQLAGLPHCAGVVMVDEEERVQRLLRTLLRQVEQRGVRGSDAGANTTVLLLDDFGSFAHQYDRPGLGSPFEHMQQILAGGRAAGVHVMLSASRRGALPAALATHFGQRLVLRMPTEEDMLSLGLDAKTIRGAQLPQGSGFTQDSREFHIAVAAEGASIMPLERAVASIEHPRPTGAAQIEVLPATVARATLGVANSLAAVPLGVSDEHLGAATVDLTELHLLVIGPYRSGRSTALATLAQGIKQADPQSSMYLISPRRSPLRELDVWSDVATKSDACAELVGSLVEDLEVESTPTSPSILFVDDGGELADALVLTRLERLVRLARDSSLRVVAAVEVGSARGIGIAWVRELRREGHGLLLQPDLAADGDLLGARLPRRVSAPLCAGRGFLVVRGASELIQVAS